MKLTGLEITMNAWGVAIMQESHSLGCIQCKPQLKVQVQLVLRVVDVLGYRTKAAVLGDKEGSTIPKATGT
jgi:hypothetical protein